MLTRNDLKPYMAAKQETLQPQLNQDNNNARLLTLMTGIGLSFCGLGAYSLWMQQYNNHDLNKLGAARVERSISDPALRGTITDRNGVVLAVSRHTKVATFNPNAIYESRRGSVNLNAVSDEQFARLAEILQLPEQEVRAKLRDTSKKYVNFKTELTMKQADEVRALGIPTLRFESRSERSYPTGNLFSHIVGFANSHGKGMEGLELSKDRLLSGEDGKQMVLRDGRGNIVELVDSPENMPAKSGDTLVLSLDQDMQRLAHDRLAAALRQWKAKAGGAVVLDAQTGEILAMASLPDYDANFYQKYPTEHLRNFSVSETMEPASVMKPFIVAKAVDAGKITRYTPFNTQPFEIGEKTIKDTALYPSLTTEGILQKSSNVGTSRIAAMFPNQELHSYFSKVGFGRKTNSGVSGEESRKLRPAEQWSKMDRAAMSYGYGLDANLLQIAQGYTIFTTDGKLMPATVFKQTHRPEGEQVIKPETARQMREMMISVTRKGGTGVEGAVPGYDVAGKTGTAKKSGSGGYTQNRYRSSFVGFAPAHNPRLIVAVVLDEPRNGYYGGAVAGPVFRDIMAGGLKLMGVKPTYLTPETQTPVQSAALKR